MIFAFKISVEIMDLGMTIVTRGNAIISSGICDLIELNLAKAAPGFRVSALESPAASTAAIVVGAVWGHIHKVFLAHNPFGHKPQVFGIGISVSLSYLITWILSREFNLPIFVPVGIDPELALADPFSV